MALKRSSTEACAGETWSSKSSVASSFSRRSSKRRRWSGWCSCRGGTDQIMKIDNYCWWQLKEEQPLIKETWMKIWTGKSFIWPRLILAKEVVNNFGQHLSFIISVLRTVFKKLVSVQAAQSAMYVWEFEPVEDGSEVKNIPYYLRNLKTLSQCKTLCWGITTEKWDKQGGTPK